METEKPAAPRRSTLVYLLYGLLMGTADAIPGVSGGTMALVVGIYERLLRAIATVFSGVGALLRFDVIRYRDRHRRVEWGLLLPLGVGIVVALVVAARFIPGLREHYPAQTNGLFLGMVAASVFIPWRRISRHEPRAVVLAVLAAVAAFLLTGLPPGAIADPPLTLVFAAAAVAICAMILPGISGAFLLVAMGMYDATLAAVDRRDLLYVLVFVLGAAVGLGLFSTLLRLLIDRYHDLTMTVLVGLMVGSLRALWPWQTDSRQLLAPHGSVVAPVVLAVIGFAVVVVIERMGRLAEAPG